MVVVVVVALTLTLTSAAGSLVRFEYWDRDRGVDRVDNLGVRVEDVIVQIAWCLDAWGRCDRLSIYVRWQRIYGEELAGENKSLFRGLFWVCSFVARSLGHESRNCLLAWVRLETDVHWHWLSQSSPDQTIIDWTSKAKESTSLDHICTNNCSNNVT